MPNVFDLSKISHLIDSQHPARILIMNTNIFMNHPDPDDWSLKADGQSVFVLSDTLVHELEFIRRREGSKEKEESRHKAYVAIKSLVNLFKQGAITEGIPIKAGWVIGVPTPKKDELDPELDQLKDIVDVFKRSDTKLLLLTRECHQLFGFNPVTLLTGELNLFNIVQMQGVPCHLVYNFPIEDLKEATAVIKPVDWNQVLGEIQRDAKQKAVVIEATLTTQRIAPSWLMSLLGAKHFMIAEGHGLMRAGNEIRPFFWTISFYPQTPDPQSSENNGDLTELPSIHLE